MVWKRSTTQSGIKTFVQGNGPSLLMIGGGPGIGSRVYRKYLEPSADRLRWHTWDCRGTGESIAAGPWSFKQDLIDLTEVIRHLRLDQTGYVLCGHSYGALLALEQALGPEARPSGLVLINAAADIRKPLVDLINRKIQRMLPNEAKEYVDGIGKLVQGTATDQDRSRFLDLEFQNHFHQASPQFREEFLRELEFSFPVFLGNIDWMGADYEPRLGSIVIPTLVFQAQNDTILPASYSAPFASIPDVKIVDLPDCGHWSFIEAADRFFIELSSFASQKLAIG